MYYKVVYVQGPLLYSAVMNDSMLMIEYKVGEYVRTHKWLEAQGYGLMVFTNRDTALQYCSCYSSSHKHDKYAVYECEIRDEMERVPLCRTSQVWRLWDKKGDDFYMFIRQHEMGHWDHSIMVKEVRLVKCITK